MKKSSEKKALISERCTGCGICISKCPKRAIEFYTENYAKKARCITELCDGCSVCVPYCPYKAISID